MRIVIAGQDTAALYAACLLKKSRPAWHIEWIKGRTASCEHVHIVANPVKPLFQLRDHDINEAMQRLTLDVSGMRISRATVSGYEVRDIRQLPYRVVSDAAMKQCLIHAANELGCVEVDDELDRRIAGSDLLIVSDPALLSRLGENGAKLVVPETTARRYVSRFSLGTKYEHLNFAIAQLPSGSITAMLIPSPDSTASLIVEASQDVLATAGQLNASGDKVAEWCASLFPQLVVKNRLMPATQGWKISQTHLANNWYAGKIAIIGFAASQPHYSIGMAARSSFEDVEALVDALLDQTNIPEALSIWQQKRLPKAQSLHRAADASAAWLLNAAMHFKMPMSRFAFACATRSQRLTYTHVKAADAAFIRDVDAIVAGPATGPRNEPPPPMFTPYTMRGLTIPNRMAFSPMCMYSSHEGTVNDFQLVHLGSRAVGGFGLVFAEMTNVRPEGRMTYQCAGMYAPEHVAAFRRITDYVHEHTQAKIAIQLAHAGRKGSISRSWERDKPLTPEEEWETLAPSAIAYTPDRPLPREMSVKDIQDVTDAFARAAWMSNEAGFDMIEIHAAHGYLLSSFISPLSNKRTDAYGGSLANRMRFPLEVLEAIRANFPSEKPISVRISASDWRPDGIQPRDAIEIAQMLQRHGADVIAVSSSGVTAERRPAVVERLYQLAFSDAIRNEGGVPTMTVGGVLSHGDCNSIIASGRADICLMARGALNDPYFPQHAAQQQGYKMPWTLPYARAAETPVRQG